MTDEIPASLLNRLSFLLGRLYFDVLALEGDKLGALGIDVKQQAALTVLFDEGPMTQQELGQRLGIDRTTIVAVVDGLDRQNLVERRRSPADRRAYQLTLTPDGRKLQRRGRRQAEAAERALLGALDEAERRTLTGLLARAVVNANGR